MRQKSFGFGWLAGGVGLAVFCIIALQQLATAQSKPLPTVIHSAPPLNSLPPNPNRPVESGRGRVSDEDVNVLQKRRGSPPVSGYREVRETIIDERGQPQVIVRMVPVSTVATEFTSKKNELNRHLQQGVAAYQATTDEEAKRAIEAKIEALLGELFDVQQQEREAQLKPMEERVKKLRETLSKRGAMRDDLVQLRLKVLLQDADGMGWGPDEFLMPGRAAGVPLDPINNSPTYEATPNSDDPATLRRRSTLGDELEFVPQEPRLSMKNLP